MDIWNFYGNKTITGVAMGVKLWFGKDRPVHFTNRSNRGDAGAVGQDMWFVGKWSLLYNS